MLKKIRLFVLALTFSVQLWGQAPPNVDKDLLLGKKELVATHPEYTLLPQVAAAFEKMQIAAQKDSIDLKIISSFRSYASQKKIWNRKYKRFINEGYTGPQAISKIIEYSTLPGTSRHHWGTDIDIIDGNKKVRGDVLLEEHFHKGAYRKLQQWLIKNAGQFGFEIVYTSDSLRKGFLYEPWHYSYAESSKYFLKMYRKMKMIKKIKKDTTLLGNEYITEAFLRRYNRENILGINPSLKE